MHNLQLQLWHQDDYNNSCLVLQPTKSKITISHHRLGNLIVLFFDQALPSLLAPAFFSALICLWLS